MMEVFLVSNVRGLGKLGSRVMVARGRARNHLFPNNLAVPVNAANVANFDRLKREAEERNVQALAGATSMRDELADVSLTFYENASEEDGRLFGSVSARQIVDKLETEYSLKVLPEAVDLPTAIKYVGQYKVRVVLHDDVDTTISVNILRNEQ